LYDPAKPSVFSSYAADGGAFRKRLLIDRTALTRKMAAIVSGGRVEKSDNIELG
jgi:hypothetical protein